MSDNVSHPIHYNQGGIECIEAIKAATVGKSGIEAFCVGNAIKYLFRYETKNGVEDAKKAAWYVNRLISELEAKEHKEDASFDYDFIPSEHDADCEQCKYADYACSQEPCYSCRHCYTNKPELKSNFEKA